MSEKQLKQESIEIQEATKAHLDIMILASGRINKTITTDEHRELRPDIDIDKTAKVFR